LIFKLLILENSIIIQSIFRQLDFNLDYAKKLVEDLSETQMTFKPADGLENFPAFTIGHLVTGCAMMVEDLGGEYKIPEGWSELFLRTGPGDPRLPNPDSNVYPSKEDLLDELERQHEKIKNILLSSDIVKISEEVKWRFHNYFPTLFDLTLFMCVNHEAMHLGQLAAWRRAAKLPSALSKL